MLTYGLFGCFVIILSFGAGGMFLCAPVLGAAFLGPKFLLNSRATARQQSIEESVPAALDLLKPALRLV